MIQNLINTINKNVYLQNNKTFYVIVSIILLLLTIIMPDTIHDYRFYVAQWEIIKNGKNPYIGTGNAYGLTYNMFAYLNIFKSIAIPKLIFIVTYLFGGYITWQESIKNKITEHNSANYSF